VVSIVLGWFVIHTMMSLHYAYEFYESPEPGGDSQARRGKNAGGFDWPKDGEPPNGVAFLYLGLQLGSSAQIADVAATSNRMRALVIAHTVFSFFYNTLLVAAAVNVVVSIAGQG
jgi:uncharacterized membrane protein